MFNRAEFESEKKIFAQAQYENQSLQNLSLNFIKESDKLNYAYQWSWLGLPIIQMPEDIVLVQEIIWETQPDIIIEAGIAWGGSVILYASILQLIGKGQVLAIDKVLPQHNIDAIMKYTFSDRIRLFKGSSIDQSIFESISKLIKPNDKVMVILDSNHTHEHVYAELEMWAPLVSKEQYLIISDTVIEELPLQEHRPRPWGVGNNPKTALHQYLCKTNRFELKNPYNTKVLNSFTRGGYLRCID